MIERESKWSTPVRAALVGTALAVAGGCAPAEAPEPSAQAPAPVLEQARNPERRGLGAAVLPEATGPSAQAILINPRRSLIVTDEVIVSQFPYRAVLDQLVAQSGVGGLTALQLHQQWWDTQNPGPGTYVGPHCDDELTGASITFNSFAYTCPRAEGNQVTATPFFSPSTNPQAYVPTALINRFDLAPLDGSDCGEYRIIYAKRSGFTDPLLRNLIIFEAVLRNPTPSAGLEGCRPVADFWANLTTVTDPALRATALRNFYFNGLAGFDPVIHINNYGADKSRPTGQLRSNQFLQGPWTLREFTLECPRAFPGGPCTFLKVKPVTVKNNPAGILFNPNSTHPRTGAFQGTDFPSQVPTLALNDLNRFSMDIPNVFNSGQSNAQGPENHYVNQFLTPSASTTLRDAVQNELNVLSSSLTPGNIVARAMTQSCAGCHELSNGANLGGGLPTWPFSLGFVHVSEQTEPGPDGPRFRISPALNTVFLPHRKAVNENFLNGACGDAVCNAWEPGFCSVDCP